MENSNQYAVDINDVVKIFPNPEGGLITAVDHVDLRISFGEFFSLLGPSGCGKTTTLRMIAGFEWPTEGEIFIKGEAMGHTPPYLRPVNTVFQSYALFQHMNVYQNVSFGLEMDHVSKAEINRRVNEVLELVQLGGMGSRKPKQLSGGQQQRVALARALVKRPTVLLLDEPLGALDLKLRKEMQLELKALQNQVGITFIYVTHDQEEALTMSNRIAVMNKGSVLQVGTPFEIYERPKCRFVADFIGETNFLSGIIRTISGNRVTVFIKEIEAEITGQSNGELSVGQEVTISIRPEKIRISDTCVLNENCLPATVITTAYIGSDTRVIIELASGIRINVWEQNKISILDPQAFYRAGQNIWVTLFPDNTYVLPYD
jgi:spermidine/putrescine transport system ATP-binding protein